MGKLNYDSTLLIDFEDRLLAHLQIVICIKLRRRESFYFTWIDPEEAGGGRSCIWLDPAVPLRYKYFDPEPPAINREWVEQLTQTANSAAGLQVVSEPNAERFLPRGES